MAIRRYIGLLILFSSIGCVSFQDTQYRWMQNHRARIAWLFNPNARCSSNPISHYSRGWQTAFADVLMGGDGRCPPVPPQSYWAPYFQSPSGEACVEAWFHGYRDGSAAALASCDGHYNPVPISGESRACSPGCLPADHAPYPYGKTKLYPWGRDAVGSAVSAPPPPAQNGVPAAPSPSDNLKLMFERRPGSYEDLPDDPSIPPAPVTSNEDTDAQTTTEYHWRKSESAPEPKDTDEIVTPIIHEQEEQPADAVDENSNGT